MSVEQARAGDNRERAQTAERAGVPALTAPELDTAAWTEESKAAYEALAAKMEAAERRARQAQAALEAAKAQGEALADGLRRQLAEKELEYALRAALPDARDPALVAGLLDKGKPKLREDGQVEGLEEQLEDLRQQKPFLFGEQAARPAFSGVTPARAGEAADAALRQIERFMGL